jgi:hypothetical protein
MTSTKRFKWIEQELAPLESNLYAYNCMQQNHSHQYTRNITVYLRIQYELRKIIYTARKLRNTPFQWYPTQVFSITSTNDIAVLGLGLGWWERFWKTLYLQSGPLPMLTLFSTKIKAQSTWHICRYKEPDQQGTQVQWTVRSRGSEINIWIRDGHQWFRCSARAQGDLSRPYIGEYLACYTVTFT